MTDKFTNMIRGKVVSNNEAKTVAQAILDKWCIEFAGYPSKSFHADNGNKFFNTDLRAACRRLDLKLTFSPAFSPWSNGGNERRHAVVDETIMKLIEDDPTNPKLVYQPIIIFKVFMVVGNKV